MDCEGAEKTEVVHFFCRVKKGQFSFLSLRSIVVDPEFVSSCFFGLTPFLLMFVAASAYLRVRIRQAFEAFWLCQMISEDTSVPFQSHFFFHMFFFPRSICCFPFSFLAVGPLLKHAETWRIHGRFSYLHVIPCPQRPFVEALPASHPCLHGEAGRGC